MFGVAENRDPFQYRDRARFSSKVQGQPFYQSPSMHSFCWLLAAERLSLMNIDVQYITCPSEDFHLSSGNRDHSKAAQSCGTRTGWPQESIEGIAPYRIAQIQERRTETLSETRRPRLRHGRNDVTYRRFLQEMGYQEVLLRHSAADTSVMTKVCHADKPRKRPESF